METRDVSGIVVRHADNPLVWLPQIEDLLASSCEESHNTWSPKTVAGAILAGEFDLWVVHDTDEILGFYLTEYLAVDQGIVVNVPFAAFHKHLEALLGAFNVAEDTAKQAGAVGFKFISSDRRWKSLAKRRGFTPRFVEYYKEF